MAASRHSHLVLGVDVGATFTRTVVVDNRLNADGPIVVAHWEKRSQGWVNGRIADKASVRASLEVDDSERSRRIDYGYLAPVYGVGNPHINGTRVSAVMECSPPQRFGDETAEQAIRLAWGQISSFERTISLASPQWIIDGKRVDVPRGREWRHLEYSAFLIQSPRSLVQELKDVLDPFRDRPTLYAFEPLAASFAVLDPWERRHGAIVLDIGAQSCGLVLWRNNSVVNARGLCAGGDLFTRDAAFAADLSFEDAERQKHEYGLLLPEHNRNHPQARLVRSALIATAERLAKMISEELDQEAHDDGRNVIPLKLVGGGSLLRGLPRFLESRLRRQVSVGIVVPPTLSGNCREVSGPVWSTAVGLACSPYWLRPWEADESQAQHDLLSKAVAERESVIEEVPSEHREEKNRGVLPEPEKNVFDSKRKPQ